METNRFFLLMHKNIAVADLRFDESGHVSILSRSLLNSDHFPIGGKLNDSKFSEWWKNRFVPDNRQGLNEALAKLGYNSTGNILVDNLALSLTDCYWIKPRGSNLTWEKVNLFENDFVDIIGEISLNSKQKIKIKKSKFNLGSSSGELKKKWCIDKDNKRILIKGNTGNSFQQSINEVFISNIHKQLKNKYYLQYDLIDLIEDNGRKIVGCKSENFCNNNVEFVSALEIIDSKKMKGSDNVFILFKQGCMDLGMTEDDFHDYMDYLILTDFLFTNIDRHLRNIGILRNPDTLKLIGFAPIFDSGNSLFYNLRIDEINTFDVNNVKINSFYNKENKMLNCVVNRNIINVDDIHPDFSLFNKDAKENQPRYKLIEKKFYQKLEMLRKFQLKNKI